MLASSGALSEDEAAASGAEVEVTGRVASMAQAVIDGNSHFYLTLEAMIPSTTLLFPAWSISCATTWEMRLH